MTNARQMMRGWGLAAVAGAAIVASGCRNHVGGADSDATVVTTGATSEGTSEGTSAGTSEGTSEGTVVASEPSVRPPHVRGQSGPVGTIELAAVQSVVQQSVARLTACYEDGLRNDAALEGRLEVRFVIARDGTMSTAVGSGDVPDPKVRTCLVNAFYGMSFDRPRGGIVTATCALTLGRRDGGPKVDAACALR